MKRQKNKRLIIILVAVVLVLTVGCAPEPVDEPDDNEVPAGQPEDESDIALSGEIVDGMRRVEVEVSNFAFHPEEIIVHEGDEVWLIFTSTDGTHEFVMDEFDLNVVIEPGETAEVTFTADTIGAYDFNCPIPGHEDKAGQLLVF